MVPKIPCLLLLLIFLLPSAVFAQDSLQPHKDTTIARKKDTPAAVVIRDTTRIDSASIVSAITDTTSVCKRERKPEDLFRVAKYPCVYGPFVGGYLKQDDTYFVMAPVKNVPALLRIVENRDWIFYLFCSLLVFVAFINLAFHKYFIDVFRVFFNTSMRQKQLREQLSQTPLPSLLLNILFCLSGGIFIFFMLRHFGIETGFHPAIEILLIVGCLAGIYIGKYIFVSLLGWMFDRKEAAENYLFTVFLVNKVAGLMLLLMSVFLAYGDKGSREVTLTLTLMILLVMGVMRLAKGFLSISGLRISLVQFLVFVGAFEVIPAMLIYKLLLRVFV